MATQGLVSIVGEDGKTIIKAVCGCEGYYADKLVERIKSKKATTAKHVYDLARTLHFGCNLCLVVMDKKDAFCADGLELSKLYRSTFDDPKFNPRWDSGTADCTRIVFLCKENAPNA